VTKTCAVNYRGRNFWAYDESLAILLHLAAEAAEEPPFEGDFPSEFVREWRVLTIVGGNFGLRLDDLCSDESRRQRFVDLMRTCEEHVRRRNGFPASVVEEWRSLGEPLIWRGGQDGVASAAPIAELASAISQLVSGGLPVPPPNHWWFVGTARGITTIAMRGSDSTSG
jgi:hypothetical protein